MLAALCSLAVFLLATPGPNHKISWCHLPPGNPANIQILSIDVAADGTIGPAHQNHAGDGPVCYSTAPIAGFDCAPNPPGVVNINPPGGILPALGANCTGPSCGQAIVFDSLSTPPNNPVVVNLVPAIAPATGCVCPATFNGTNPGETVALGGLPPAPLSPPVLGLSLSCGAGG